MRQNAGDREATSGDILGAPDRDAEGIMDLGVPALDGRRNSAVPNGKSVSANAIVLGETPAEEPVQAPRARLDVLQLLFWISLIIAVAAATVSIAWRDAVGEAGSILLIAFASTGMVVLLWLARGAGRWLGLFPERGAAETAVAAQALKPRYPWIESLDEAVLVTERGGAPVTCNAAFVELSSIAAGLGESHGPVTVDRLFGGSPGVTGPIFRLAKAAKAGRSHNEVLPAMALGRDARPVQFSVSVSPLSNGKVLWRLRETMVGESRNIAADPKALYIEDAPVGFFVSRPDGSVSYLNAWLRELLGLPEGEVVRRVEDIMRAESVRMLRRERKGDTTMRAQLTLIARDGIEVPVQAVTTWTGRGLEATGRTIVSTPNGALIDKAARLTSPSASRPPRDDVGDPIFDDAPFGAIRLDGSNVESAIIVDANRAMMSLTDGRAAPGMRFADLFMAEEGELSLSERLVDSIDHAVSVQLAGEPVRHVNVRVALDPAGAPVTAYLMDMTAQRELEMRVHHGQKMQALGQFAGGLAHDFNNMLQGIILAVDKLMIRHPVGDPSFSDLKDINEWSARASELIRMMKAYARMETLKREVIDVTEWLSDFSLMLTRLVDERVTVDFVHGRDLPKIKHDKSQLEASLMNLTTNARDAMISKGGGRLTIRTEAVTAEHAHQRGFSYVEGGQYLLIAVTDTGTGIPADKLSRIFEPFFTTKDKNKGTGLGLSTVYGIVKQSGGYICPETETGKGTTFYLYLPVMSAEEVEAWQQAEAAAAAEELAKATSGDAGTRAAKARSGRPSDMSGRGRILLIEDEDGVRGIASHLLTSFGYEVVEAADGEKAYAVLEANPCGFDLVISDVILPGIDGPSLLRKARGLIGQARVIFISGYAERDLAKALDEEADVAFLPKPFTLRQLAEKVKEELLIGAEAAA